MAVVPLLIITVIITGMAPQKTENNKFLPVGEVVAESLIGAPPEVGSPEFNRQMAVVLWMQKIRTPEQVTFVEKPLNFDRFAPILGHDLDVVDRVALEETLDEVISQVRQNYDAVKDRYDYPRPFKVSDAVKPVGDARPVASYPSGHAIRATVYARLLTDIFPEREAELSELARQIGYGRVTAGVHYPMDVISGQLLGNAYADVILKQPAFQEAVVRIRGIKE
tara:strand:- start:596 stop:1264 length:669 start_codon:yes stop_codon:yes gene_type:complete